MTRINGAFTALIVAQAAHSVEEYVGRLWESFAPARFVSGLISPDLEVGFIAFNAVFVALGVWCALVPVTRQWRSARNWLWFWVVVETVNGFGHVAWSLIQGGYTPGVLTAPLLFGLALYIASELRRHA
jgi:hypothetical protein